MKIELVSFQTSDELSKYKAYILAVVAVAWNTPPPWQMKKFKGDFQRDNYQRCVLTFHKILTP